MNSDQEHEQEDDSIVLRTGEASRLRRRGAIRSHTVVAGGIGSHGAGLGRNGSSSSTGGRRRRKTFQLFCGHCDSGDDEFHWASDPFEPSPFPLFPSSPSSSSSIGTTKKKSKRNEGCGQLIHSSASLVASSLNPSTPSASTYTANTPPTSLVVPLTEEYFPDELAKEGRTLKECECGCVREGIGCRVCGTPLGTRYRSCQNARRSQIQVFERDDYIYTFFSDAVHAEEVIEHHDELPPEHPPQFVPQPLVPFIPPTTSVIPSTSQENRRTESIHLESNRRPPPRRRTIRIGEDEVNAALAREAESEQSLMPAPTPQPHDLLSSPLPAPSSLVDSSPSPTTATSPTSPPPRTPGAPRLPPLPTPPTLTLPSPPLTSLLSAPPMFSRRSSSSPSLSRLSTAATTSENVNANLRHLEDPELAHALAMPWIGWGIWTPGEESDESDSFTEITGGDGDEMVEPQTHEDEGEEVSGTGLSELPEAYAQYVSSILATLPSPPLDLVRELPAGDANGGSGSYTLVRVDSPVAISERGEGEGLELEEEQSAIGIEVGVQGNDELEGDNEEGNHSQLMSEYVEAIVASLPRPSSQSMVVPYAGGDFDGDSLLLGNSSGGENSELDGGTGNEMSGGHDHSEFPELHALRDEDDMPPLVRIPYSDLDWTEDEIEHEDMSIQNPQAEARNDDVLPRLEEVSDCESDWSTDDGADSDEDEGLSALSSAYGLFDRPEFHNAQGQHLGVSEVEDLAFGTIPMENHSDSDSDWSTDNSDGEAAAESRPIPQAIQLRESSRQTALPTAASPPNQILDIYTAGITASRPRTRSSPMPMVTPGTVESNESNDRSNASGLSNPSSVPPLPNTSSLSSEPASEVEGSAPEAVAGEERSVTRERTGDGEIGRERASAGLADEAAGTRITRNDNGSASLGEETPVVPRYSTLAESISAQLDRMLHTTRGLQAQVDSSRRELDTSISRMTPSFPRRSLFHSGPGMGLGMRSTLNVNSQHLYPTFVEASSMRDSHHPHHPRTTTTMPRGLPVFNHPDGEFFLNINDGSQIFNHPYDFMVEDAEGSERQRQDDFPGSSSNGIDPYWYVRMRSITQAVAMSEAEQRREPILPRSDDRDAGESNPLVQRRTLAIPPATSTTTPPTATTSTSSIPTSTSSAANNHNYPLRRYTSSTIRPYSSPYLTLHPSRLMFGAHRNPHFSSSSTSLPEDKEEEEKVEEEEEELRVGQVVVNERGSRGVVVSTGKGRILYSR